MGEGEPLPGGSDNQDLIRVGDTVRRRLRPSSLTVQAYLAHLRDAGFAGAPLPLGVDEHGREVLSYVPGQVHLHPLPPEAAREDVLAALARMVRALHEASAGWEPPADAVWGGTPDNSGRVTEPFELVSHRDYATGNVVFRDGLPAALGDPRGWEVFVPRAIAPGEVHRVRRVPQVAGWRYQPGAHGARPCTCSWCRVRGGYGARRLLERLPHPDDGPPPPAAVLLATIAAAGDPGDPDTLREALHWLGMRRRGPLPELARLAAHPDPRVREALVWAVARWSTPGVAELLSGLADDPDPDVREAVEMTSCWLRPRRDAEGPSVS